MKDKISLELTTKTLQTIKNLLGVEQDMMKQQVKKLFKDKQCPGEVYQRKLDYLESISVAIEELKKYNGGTSK